MPPQQQHWTTNLHLTPQWETSPFLQYLTYSELTSINWKQSPGQQWHFSHNTSFLRNTQHPKAGSVSSHHSSSAGIDLHNRVQLVELCVSDILLHKRKKGNNDREKSYQNNASENKNQSLGTTKLEKHSGLQKLTSLSSYNSLGLTLNKLTVWK